MKNSAGPGMENGEAVKAGVIEEEALSQRPN
jgi:hypothetical protein